MPFVHKSVSTHAGIGEDLKELRERAGWSISQIAEKTKIDPSLIRALEREAWDEILDPIYTERILKAYIAFLKGKEKYFLQKYRARLVENNIERKPEETIPRPNKIQRRDLTVIPRWVHAGMMIVAGLALGLIVILQIRSLNAPPILEVMDPIEGAHVTDPVVVVQGKTTPESTVMINGRTVAVQENGSFTFSLEIPRGASIITITSQRRRSRPTAIERHVIYDRLPAKLPSYF